MNEVIGKWTSYISKHPPSGEISGRKEKKERVRSQAAAFYHVSDEDSCFVCG